MEFLVFNFRETFLEFISLKYCDLKYTLFYRKHSYKVTPKCHLAIFDFVKIFGKNTVGYSFM